MEELIRIQEKLREKQKTKRFVHTLGVQYTSASLAMCYGLNVEKASLAGLLHDCAKHLNNEKLIRTCRDAGMEISPIELSSPYLLHGKAGSVLAQEKYRINDQEILNAIIYHTTGRPEMSMLEKIVFTADYIEPARCGAPNLQVLRQLAFQNLDLAVLKITEQTLEYLRSSHQAIDETTELTYHYYKDIEMKKRGGQDEL